MVVDCIEKVVSELRQQTRNSNVLQGSALIERIARNTELDAATIRNCFKEMRARGWVEASSWSGTGNPVGRVKVSLPPLPPPLWADGWKRALAASEQLSEADRETLYECGSNLSDMDASEFPKILDGLVRLRKEQSELIGSPAFLVSARYLRGSSKILGKLGARAIKAFGINLLHFTDHPQYVVTAGSANPETVVLVENPAAFELAVTTKAIEHCAFISTFGFGLNKSSEDFGNQLAGMVEERFSRAVTLTREGSSGNTSARELLTHSNITFWGDLDIAGMAIYERIAKSLPNIKLSALYEPAIKAVLEHDHRHPYVSAVGKSGQVMFKATRPDTIKMLSYCSEWAADQELVTESQIEELAGEVLAL